MDSVKTRDESRLIFSRGRMTREKESGHALVSLNTQSTSPSEDEALKLKRKKDDQVQKIKCTYPATTYRLTIQGRTWRKRAELTVFKKTAQQKRAENVSFATTASLCISSFTSLCFLPYREVEDQKRGSEEGGVEDTKPGWPSAGGSASGAQPQVAHIDRIGGLLARNIMFVIDKRYVRS